VQVRRLLIKYVKREQNNSSLKQFRRRASPMRIYQAGFLAAVTLPSMAFAQEAVTQEAPAVRGSIIAI
jgi:hypothetical protein